MTTRGPGTRSSHRRTARAQGRGLPYLCTAARENRQTRQLRKPQPRSPGESGVIRRAGRLTQVGAQLLGQLDGFVRRFAADGLELAGQLP